MCKCKKKGVNGNFSVGTMPAMNDPDWMLVAATVAGGAASNIVVNSIANTVFSKASTEDKKLYAGFLKVGVGLAGVLYAPKDVIGAAAFGMMIDGSVNLLQSYIPQLNTLVAIKGTGGIGEVIDLSREDWSELNGIESDHSVGYAQEYAVSGGVN